jgi:hypothetical protein
VTRGSYTVALPDGRVQIVTYIADDDGFKAEVSYEGEPSYPSPSEYTHENPAPGVFHALPPVTHSKNHANILHGHAQPAAAEPVPSFYDEYDYHDDTPPHEIKSLVTPYAYPTTTYAPPPTPKAYTPTPHAYNPTPYAYTPTPSYAPPTPQPAYYSKYPNFPHGGGGYASPTTPLPPPVTATPSYVPTSPVPHDASPTYGAPTTPRYSPVTPTYSPYVHSPSTVKSLLPKKYGKKLPGYATPTLSPAYQYYSPTTFRPSTGYINEVFKRKAEPKSSIDTYDYQYYEYNDDDNSYVASSNRRSDHHQVQLIIADHLHQDDE